MSRICAVWLAALLPACAGQVGGEETPSTAPPRGPDLGIYSGDGGARLDAAATGCAAGEEICDGLDNDCDGRVDEIGCPCVGPPVCYGGPPATRGLGECRDGERGCDPTGEYFTECAGWVGPVPEVCDGRDDDCDGQVDDDCCEAPPCEGGGGDGGGGGAGGGGGGAGGAAGAGGGPPEADAGSPGAPREDRFIVGQDEVVRPADFIMAVDNSASMKDTVAEVEANLGAFATRLVGAAVDYRFVLVSEKGATRRDPDVCIPPPMAGPDCADTDRFHHLDERVDSHSAFSDILQCFHACEQHPGGYGDFLRPDSLLQVIVVTDDESVVSWDAFRDGMADLGRPDLVLHGVVGLDAEGCAARVGHEYVFGAQATGGEVLDICDQDWGRVLEVVFNQTVLRLQFTFALTAPPRPASLRVFVVVGGAPEEEQRGNWRYEPARNYVVFDPNESPPLGAVVIARYVTP